MNLTKLDQYLDSLPQGLDSYPDYVQKASIYRKFLEMTRLGEFVPSLPSRLVQLVEEPALPSDWIPEVHVTALYVAGQYLYNDDAAYVEHWYEVNRSVLQGRLYRMLMVVASPMLVLSGADKRWGALHRGVELDVRTSGDCEVELSMRYPRHLYPRIIVEGINQAFRAVVESAGAREVTAITERWEPESSLTRIRWA